MELNPQITNTKTTPFKTIEPWISINKLAEYMTANPIRRRQIISVLKQDSDFRKARYVEVRNAFLPYFQNGYDTDILDEVTAKVEAKNPITTWDENDNKNSLLAIQGLIDTDLPDLSDYSITTDALEVKHVLIGGVMVFIKPDLYFQHKESGKFGALKVHIAKTPENRLEEENRIYVATMLKYGMSQAGGVPEKDIDINACLSVDVFLSSYSYASATYKRKVAAIEAACEEIATRWNSV